MIIEIITGLGIIGTFLLILHLLEGEAVISVLTTGFIFMVLGLVFFSYIWWAAIIGVFFIAIMFGMYFIHNSVGD